MTFYFWNLDKGKFREMSKKTFCESCLSNWLNVVCTHHPEVVNNQFGMDNFSFNFIISFYFCVQCAIYDVRIKRRLQ